MDTSSSMMTAISKVMAILTTLRNSADSQHICKTQYQEGQWTMLGKCHIANSHHMLNDGLHLELMDRSNGRLQEDEISRGRQRTPIQCSTVQAVLLRSSRAFTVRREADHLLMEHR
jgi:hypothetical protein